MKRTKCNLSHNKLFSCNMGQLIPATCVEVLPGDSFKHHTKFLVRVSPLLAPMYHKVRIRAHHWFVPYRLLWTEWENFITGGPGNDDNPTYPTVITPLGGIQEGSLADYLGVQVGSDVAGFNLDALQFRAYAMIFNEYYRDQDLQTELPISKASGVDTTTSTDLQNVCWQKDYFTSARPTPQKGPDITIPLGSDAPIVPTGNARPTFRNDGSTFTSNVWTAAGEPEMYFSGNAPNTEQMRWADPKLQADLANADAATINELRAAFAIQRFAENRDRFGSRYPEYLASLGVKSSDARLQRPEYLGGGVQNLSISEVLQTAPNQDEGGESTDVGVAEMKGHGIAAMRSNSYRYFFEEHGLVMTLFSVLPDTGYSQGIPKRMLRRSRFDFWQKELQNIGQEAIQKQELVADNPLVATEPWGYVDRNESYRRIPNTIAGEFRSVLNYWHMYRKFDALPSLNGDFVKSDPTNRVYASTATDQLLVYADHTLIAKRLITDNPTPIVI